MLICEGYKMFKGLMKVGSNVIEGTWLFKPEYKCWYCNGCSYPENVCEIIKDMTK